MRHTLALAAAMSIVVLSVAPAMAASVGPWSVPSWLQGLEITVDPITGQLVGTSGKILDQAINTGSKLVIEEVAAESADTFLGRLLSGGFKVLGKLGSVGGAVVIGVLTDPLQGGVVMNATLCVDATHDDFKSFSGDCPQSATYKPSTPLKLRWSVLSEYDPTTCSGFGSWDKDIPPSLFTGSETFNISRVPGKYVYYLGCEGFSKRSLFGDLVGLHFITFFKDLWSTITGKPLQETVVTFSEVGVDVVNAPVPPTLTVFLSANPPNLTLPSDGGTASSFLTASIGGTAQGNINYTFYCNRSDKDTNITVPNDGKFDNVSNTSQPSTCSYSSPGVYTAKVIAERGTLAAQWQSTVVVNQAAAPPGKPAVDIKVQ